MTAETELPAYLPYHRFLLKMDISHTAKLLYALLLDRSTLSQKNGWQDSEGRTYICLLYTSCGHIISDRVHLLVVSVCGFCYAFRGRF